MLKNIAPSFQAYLRHFGRFAGRSQKGEYIAGIVILCCMDLVMLSLTAYGPFDDANWQDNVDGAQAVFILILLFWRLVSFVLTLGLLARRFHDFNYNGWWGFLSLIISNICSGVIIGIMVITTPYDLIDNTLSIISNLLFWCFLLPIAFIRSDKKLNRFGPAPEIDRSYIYE